ncbi:DUF5819 family protein [Microbacterium sp. NPDC087665]|uniref:DUF5819 family protein n=1 Tax=Microbacterium sp. NPDC087665 TaxID=3364194 RepID=UPI003825ACCB
MIRTAHFARWRRTKTDRTDEGGAATANRWTVRIVSAALVLLTAWHVFASFLWIYPPSALRQLPPENALSSYMLPLFGQSWSVFAPEPINGDYHFNVRALVVNEAGNEVETGWVSATDVELSMVKNNLFPPRAGIQAEELASSFKNSWDGLAEKQRELTLENYTDDEWLATLEEDLDRVDDDIDAEKYIGVDRMATAYATQVAHAIWGEDVVAVQFRVSRQNVVPFADRNDPNAQRPEPTIIRPGWRDVLVEPGQNEDRFAEVFRSQYETYLKGLNR